MTQRVNHDKETSVGNNRTDSVTGNDISHHITAGSSAPVFIGGNADKIILPAAMGNLAITDNGQGTGIVLSSAVAAGATITIHDFQNDATGLICLPRQNSLMAGRWANLIWF